jgi:hypothetical protein
MGQTEVYEMSQSFFIFIVPGEFENCDGDSDISSGLSVTGQIQSLECLHVFLRRDRLKYLMKL